MTTATGSISVRVDSLAPSGVDFRGSSPGGPPARTVEFDDFAGVATEVVAFTTNPDGTLQYLFDGEYLYDGATRRPLANAAPLGAYPPSPAGPQINTNEGPSYLQPLLLVDPGDDARVYVFYGMANSPRLPAYDRNLPAWMAIYDARLDSFVVRDRQLHTRGCEGWTAQRHPNGRDWWVLTRQHSPSALLTYRLTPTGVNSGPIVSPGGSPQDGTGVSDASAITFSPDGRHVAVAVTDPRNALGSPSEAEVWLWDFDCRTGRCSNPVLLDDNGAVGIGVGFSPGGAYVYAPVELQRSDPYPLARWAVPPALGTTAAAPREWVPGGHCRYGVQRGPDGRVYTGPANSPEVFDDVTVGYVDRPERWLAHERLPDGRQGPLVRADGAAYTGIPRRSGSLYGLTLPTLPIDLPELRTPHLRGDNVTTCGATGAYRLVENCYQTLADVTATPGPGVTVVQRRGADVTLRFDSVAAAGAPALVPVRYVALAHAHACRTYRDTLWVLVEGTCNEPLGCVAAAVAAPVTQRGCDSARVLGRMRDVAGLYRDTLAGIAQGGCDSVRQVQLTLGQTVRTASAMSICAGQTALIHGRPESEPADYTQTFSSAAGCDSVSTVTLAVTGQAVAPAVAQAGCDSVAVFGVMRDVAGLYLDTLIGAARGGCDSVRQVQLTLGQTVRTASAMSICVGQTALIHGQPESAAADYSQTFTSVTGCDSVSTVTLAVAGQAVAPAVMQAGCDSVVVFGRMRDVAGLYLDTLIGAARGGCDSVRQVQLTLGQTVRTASAMSICVGQTALIHGQSESAAADYSQTFTSVTGCDSVSTVTLAVAGQAVAPAVMQAGCDSVVVFGRMRDVAGLYLDTLVGQARGGCDSVRQVQLTLGQTVRTASAMSICAGQTALIHGRPESAAADYSQTFTSVTGCDSVSTVTLAVAGQAVAPAVAQAGCDSVAVFGRMREVSGLYLDTLVGAARSGCDSVRQVQLTLGQTVRTASAMSICAGQTALIHGQPESAAADYKQTFTSLAGCDSVSTVTLAVGATVVAAVDTVRACDSAQVFGVMRDTPGVYRDTLLGRARGGCDSVRQVTLQLTARPTWALAGLPGDTTLAPGDTLAVAVAGGGADGLGVRWTPPGAVACDTCARTAVAGTFDGRVSLAVAPEGAGAGADAGCVAEHMFRIARLVVADEEVVEVYTPTAFSPNGDGVNDDFALGLPVGWTVVAAEVYDRWGGLVRRVGAECPCERDGQGMVMLWDGRAADGRAYNPAVFVWWARVRRADGEEVVVKGDVTLVR